MGAAESLADQKRGKDEKKKNFNVIKKAKREENGKKRGNVIPYIFVSNCYVNTRL